MACEPKNCGSDMGFYEGMTKEQLDNIKKHPCYSMGAAHNQARMHIPVAPKCNIKCNYCNRKFDCVNETRPGVTSSVLTPEAAVEKYRYVKEKIANLSVVGIAGPGDALANWSETKRAIELLREEDEEAIVCLSTNGLMLPKYAKEIIELGVKHITITINSIDPNIGKDIYHYVSYDNKLYTGYEAAKILQKNQLKGLSYLSENGALCKVNIVLIEGINDKHIKEVVKEVRDRGAFMTNIMPLIPAQGTRFEDFPLVSRKRLDEIRRECSIDLRQMTHCQQCRADAIGKLTQDRSLEFKDVGKKRDERVRVAIASRTGEIIDQHFGQVDKLYIYEMAEGDVELMDIRDVGKYCSGVEECDDKKSSMSRIKKVIDDCSAVLCVRIGEQPKRELLESGIKTFEIYDRAETGVRKVAARI